MPFEQFSKKLSVLKTNQILFVAVVSLLPALFLSLHLSVAGSDLLLLIFGYGLATCAPWGCSALLPRLGWTITPLLIWHRACRTAY